MVAPRRLFEIAEKGLDLPAICIVIDNRLTVCIEEVSNKIARFLNGSIGSWLPDYNLADAQFLDFRSYTGDKARFSTLI